MDERVAIGRDGLEALFRALRDDGRRVIGPTVRDGAIVLAELDSVAALPEGWTETQAPGRYRLERRDDSALFGFSSGPQAWRRFLQVPREPLFSARRGDRGLAIEPAPVEAPRLAFLGARSCDLAAIAIQDRVLVEGPFKDARYAARRSDIIIIAVQCVRSGGTCFCASMKTGPRATSGFDLALTEVGRDFVVEVGSDSGRALLARLPHRPCDGALARAADEGPERAAREQTRALDPRGARDVLLANLEHARWDEVAGRCIACTNCTIVCPTCFCSTTEDQVDLSGNATRSRAWDSCFTLGHSWIAGGSVRATVRARYRQWLTHKLATWWDQFGTSGCVGCGRCITWCPVGIDIVEEVHAMEKDRGGDRG
jgi:ferredoxin